MPHKITISDDVARQVASFPEHLRYYWPVCLSEIAFDPAPRHGYYVDRIIDIPGAPTRTFVYEIREETSISEERFFAFMAEFSAEDAILYAVDEVAMDVGVFYLRPLP